jgi:predicted hydrocarbon binding protein
MTSTCSSETGYMTLIAGLLEILEEANGIEVTEDMMYLNGKRRGEHIGKKIGVNKDPGAAIYEFIKYIRPYYEIEIIEEGSTKNGYKVEFRVNKCMIKELCKDRGIAIKNPLCKSTHGFIEGALSFMTGMQVSEDTRLANWETCQGSVEFKQKRSIFGLLL